MVAVSVAHSEALCLLLGPPSVLCGAARAGAAAVAEHATGRTLAQLFAGHPQARKALGDLGADLTLPVRGHPHPPLFCHSLSLTPRRHMLGKPHPRTASLCIAIPKHIAAHGLRSARGLTRVRTL